MSHPITIAKIVLVADRRRRPTPSARAIRRFRLARVSGDPRGARAADASPRAV